MGRWFPTLLALVLVVAVRAWIGSGLDLAEVPGPAGPQVLGLALTGTGPGWDSWILGHGLRFWDADPVRGAFAVMGGFGLLAVLGATLAAGAVAGPRAAAGAALVAGLWSQPVVLSSLVGGDALAGGLAWLGVGLAFVSRRLRWTGLPLALLGGVLAMMGPGVKITSTPVIAYLAILPFLGSSGLGWTLSQTALAWTGAWLGRAWLVAHFRLPAGASVLPSLAPVQDGWARLLGLQAHLGFDGALVPLALLAGLGVLVPSRRPRAAILLGALTWAVVGYTAASLEGHLRPRYLVFAAFGLVILGGVAVGNLGTWLRPLHATWLPACLVAGGLLVDTLAYVQAWSTDRHEMVGSLPTSLPRPSAWFLARNRNVDYDASLSVVGGKDLFTLARTSPRGVAGFYLPDRREAHMDLAALLARVPSIVLRSDACCPDRFASEACATGVVAMLDGAGIRLVLPNATGDHLEPPGQPRVDPRDRPWVAWIRQAAQARHPITATSRWWDTWQGTGTGGPLPCQR